MAIYKIGTKYRDFEFSTQWAHGPSDLPDEETEDEKLFDEEIEIAIARLDRIRKKLSG